MNSFPQDRFHTNGSVGVHHSAYQQQPGAPYFQQQQLPLPPAIQNARPHASTQSPHVHSNSLPPQSQETNNLFYQLQQATSAQQSPQTSQQQLSPQVQTPQRQSAILPPARNSAHHANQISNQNIQTSQEHFIHDPIQDAAQNGQLVHQQSSSAGPDSHTDSPIPSQSVAARTSSPLPDILPNLTQADMIPPPEATYATFDELLHHANQHAFAHGYALVIARSKKKGPHNYKKVLIACDRWGPVQHSGMRPEHLRKRVTSSKKTDCKFGVLAQESATEWKLCHRPDAVFQTHNHGPSQDMSKHAAARKLNAAAMAAVKVYADAGLSVKETVEQIQLAQPGAMVIARDVYNARALLKREPAKFPDVDPALLPPIVTRAKMTPEEKIRDECRVEVVKAKEETDQARAMVEAVRDEMRGEIESLKKKLIEKDKLIERFEMFIDICNQRVMVQRERLNDDGGPANGGPGGV